MEITDINQLDYYINENQKYDIIRTFNANDMPNFILFSTLKIDFKSACAEVMELFEV